MAHRVTSGAAAATRKEAFLPSCPVCAGQKSAAFYGLKAAPVTNASVFATKEEACAVARGTVELCACDFCGLVFNRAFDPRCANRSPVRKLTSRFETFLCLQPRTGVRLGETPGIDRQDRVGNRLRFR